MLCKKLARWARKWPNFLQDCKILARHAIFARNYTVLQQDTQHNIVRSWSTWVTTSPARCFSTKNHPFGSVHKSNHDGIVRMDIASSHTLFIYSCGTIFRSVITGYGNLSYNIHSVMHCWAFVGQKDKYSLSTQGSIYIQLTQVLAILAASAEESLTQSSVQTLWVNPSLDGWQSQLSVWRPGVPIDQAFIKAWIILHLIIHSFRYIRIYERDLPSVFSSALFNW